MKSNTHAKHQTLGESDGDLHDSLISTMNNYYLIPEVTDELIEPKIKIYDPNGSIWFNKIGFNRKITDEWS